MIETIGFGIAENDKKLIVRTQSDEREEDATKTRNRAEDQFNHDDQIADRADSRDLPRTRSVE